MISVVAVGVAAVAVVAAVVVAVADQIAPHLIQLQSLSTPKRRLFDPYSRRGSCEEENGEAVWRSAWHLGEQKARSRINKDRKQLTLKIAVHRNCGSLADWLGDKYKRQSEVRFAELS